MLTVEIHEPMYRADISIFTCPFSEFTQIISERHPGQILYSWDQPFDLEPGTDGYQFHVNGENGQGEQFYVWMFEPDAYTTAHEFHHLAHDILFTRGLRCNYETEEVFAFLVGRLHEMYEASKPKADEWSEIVGPRRWKLQGRAHWQVPEDSVVTFPEGDFEKPLAVEMSK